MLLKAVCGENTQNICMGYSFKLVVISAAEFYYSDGNFVPF